MFIRIGTPEEFLKGQSGVRTPSGLRRRRPRGLHWNVAPRYTAGSPAMVPEHIARQVAKEEKEAYERLLTGIYGEADKATAEKLGLKGIVEERFETKKGWDVTDVLTGEQFIRPFAR
jgi:hypothetical protein